MAEYIEREAFEHFLMGKRKLLYADKDLVLDVAYHVNKFPAADVAPVVHGRWKMKCIGHQDFVSGEYDENYYIECSECGRTVWDVDQTAAIFGNWEKISKDFPYCHCGAKMDGVADG